MENATEALKMAFGVLIFVIAITAAFMLVTQARSTADVIFTAKDDQEYVNGITSIGQQKDDAGNLIQYRLVGIDTIVPTIYRYAQENYGVIIIDDEDIVGIYDLIVENTVSKYDSTWDTNSRSQEELEKICLGSDTEGIEGIQDYVYNATGKGASWNISYFKKLFRGDTELGIYTIKTPDSTSCPWTSSTYNIMQRIRVDMEGVEYSTPYKFGNGTLEYRGAFFDTDTTKNGFIKKYKKDDAGNPIMFKEYYYNVKSTNHLTEEEETDRIQIIYVKQ